MKHFKKKIMGMFMCSLFVSGCFYYFMAGVVKSVQDVYLY